MSIGRIALLIAVSLALVVTTAQADPVSARAGFKAQFPSAKMLEAEDTPGPRMVYGFLATADRHRLPQDQARHFLDRNRGLFAINDVLHDLSFTKQASFRQGRLVVFAQQWQGIPVYNAGIKVVLDLDGNVKRVHNRFHDIPEMVSSPTITPYEAIAEAWLRVYGVPTNFLPERALGERWTKLYVWHRGENVRLAYAVGMPYGIITERKVAFIDAHSGEFLNVLDGIRYARMANVWEANPGADGNNPTVEREIGGLNEGATEMVGPQHYAFNCPDDGDRMSVPMIGSIPVCTERHLASADGAGDFLYEPAFGSFTDAGVADDEFCEVHMFYHVDLIYRYFQDLALYIDPVEPPFSMLSNVPFRSVCNFKVPGILSGGGLNELGPFDQAMYVAQDGIFGFYPPEDSIVFGQGQEVDFSYDGEVIYHEFTHAVIDSELHLQATDHDQFGMITDPGAMNEGYADFFSATYVGDPHMAEYMGSAFEDSGVLRDLENTKFCPNDVKGEVHEDSEWWSGALWTVREHFKTAEGDATKINAAIFEALLSISNVTPSYTEAAEATAISIGEWFSEDSGAEEYARQIFTDRGLFNCNRAIPVTENQAIDGMLFIAEAQGYSPFTPGYMQFHLQVPADVTYVRGEFYAAASGGLFGGGVDADFFIRSGEPVAFSYGRTVEATYDSTSHAEKWASAVPDADRYVFILTPAESETFAAGDYYVAMGNNAQGGGIGGMMGGTPMYMMKFQYETGEAPCMADEDCGECEQCTDNHECEPIGDECETDEDCRRGYACEVGECGMECNRAPIDGDTPEDGDEPTDGDVPVDGDTPEDGDVPVDGDVPEDGDEPEPNCETSADCDECEVCVGGFCMETSGDCESSDDCEDDQICVEGPCGGECQETDDVDGDLTADGDESGGEEETPGSGDSGCRQGTSVSWMMLLLLMGLAGRRLRRMGTC